MEDSPESGHKAPQLVSGVTLDKSLGHSKPYFPYLHNGGSNSPLSGRTWQGNSRRNPAKSMSSIYYCYSFLKFIWEHDGVWLSFFPNIKELGKQWANRGSLCSREKQGLRWEGGHC